MVNTHNTYRLNRTGVSRQENPVPAATTAAPPHPVKLPKYQTPIAADDVVAHGLNRPKLPPPLQQSSPAACVLSELSQLCARILVYPDQVKLYTDVKIPPDLKARFDQNQAGMIELLRPQIPADQVQACVDWLREFGTPTKTIRTWTDSYSLKHIVERWDGHYVCNGAFIVAAIREGYTAVPSRDDRFTAEFNLSFAKWNTRLRQHERDESTHGRCGTYTRRSANQSIT